MAKKSKIKNNKQKNNKKQQNNNIVSKNEITNLIKILLILCAILLLFYFITEWVTKKDKNNVYTENTIATIQYDKILVGQILNQKEKQYYVLVEKQKDQYLELYNYYLSSYSGEKDGLKYYRVDLNDVFNSNHVGEKTELKGNVSEFKFANTTLLLIKNGAISKIYEDRDSIVSYLENLK